MKRQSNNLSSQRGKQRSTVSLRHSQLLCGRMQDTIHAVGQPRGACVCAFVRGRQ